MNQVGQGKASPEIKKATRLENLIGRFETLARQANDLSERTTSLVVRVVGSRPTDETNASVPKPVPNGRLQELEAYESSIGTALEHIRNELGELESAL